LFAISISPFIAAHRVHLHHRVYDDICCLTSDVSPFDVVSYCVSDISRWFLENGMVLNPSKTEAVLFGTCAKRNKIYTSTGIVIAGIKVAFSSTVKLLSVTLDEDLSLDRHVTVLFAVCSYHTRALRRIRSLINLSSARMVACDVTVELLQRPFPSAQNVERLQVAQNSLAQAMCHATWSSSATELRRLLHWLPMKQRVDYKVAVIAYKTRSTEVPSYLSTLIKDYEPGRSLRSSDRLLLRPPRAKLACSRRDFSVNAPMVWNSFSFILQL